MKPSKIKGKYKTNYNLKHLTWFKVGGNAEVFFKPEDQEDLILFLQENNGDLPITVLGAGSNIIIRDGDIEGCVIKLGKGFSDIKILQDGSLSVGSACLNFNLAKFALSHHIKNFEFLVGIPGSIGGGVAMNAGSYGSEFKDIVSTVYAIDKFGNQHEFKNSEIGFAYRSNKLPDDLIFTKVIFKSEMGDFKSIEQKMQDITNMRSKTQPIKEKTGGSTFANPPGYKAWELIDKSGLRGKRIGDAAISDKHCNFMLNTGNATATDMENLGNLVRNVVEEKTGVKLNWEIKRLGRNEKSS